MMVERNASRVQIRPGAERQEESQLNPGDQAAPGTPGTGENICPQCQGRGRLENDRPCPNCGGSGKIIEGISGG